jgi:hypothetical protein
MDSNLIFQAIVGGAPLRHAPSVQASYAALKTHLLALTGENAALHGVLLAYENNPAAARLDALPPGVCCAAPTRRPRSPGGSPGCA